MSSKNRHHVKKKRRNARNEGYRRSTIRCAKLVRPYRTCDYALAASCVRNFLPKLIRTVTRATNIRYHRPGRPSSCPVLVACLASTVRNGRFKGSFNKSLLFVQERTFDTHRSFNNSNPQSGNPKTTVFVECIGVGRHCSDSIKRTGDRPHRCTHCANRVSRTGHRVTEAIQTADQVGN
jgi:hypothetical protein